MAGYFDEEEAVALLSLDEDDELGEPDGEYCICSQPDYGSELDLILPNPESLRPILGPSPRLGDLFYRRFFSRLNGM